MILLANDFTKLTKRWQNKVQDIAVKDNVFRKESPDA